MSAQRARTRRRGITLIEILLAGMIMVIIGAGLFNLIRSSYDSQYILMNQNNANTDARAAVDTLADNVRGLATLTAGTSSGLIFTDTSGNAIRYWYNSTSKTIRTSTNGTPSLGTQVIKDVQSLVFTYWSYNGSTWSSSTSPSPLSNVGAIDITAVVNSNGYQRQVFSSVKLRQKRFNNTNGF